MFRDGPPRLPWPRVIVVKSRELRVRPSWWFDIQAAETLLRAVLEARMNDPDERARQSAQTFKNLLEESPQGWGA